MEVVGVKPSKTETKRELDSGLWFRLLLAIAAIALALLIRARSPF